MVDVGKRRVESRSPINRAGDPAPLDAVRLRFGKVGPKRELGNRGAGMKIGAKDFNAGLDVSGEVDPTPHSLGEADVAPKDPVRPGLQNRRLIEYLNLDALVPIHGNDDHQSPQAEAVAP
jgi:hypothetical protein